MRSLSSHHTFLRRRVSIPYWGLLLGVVAALLFRLVLWPAPNLTVIAAARLAMMHQSYDGARDEHEWGLHVGDLDLAQYTTDLKEAWTRLFPFKSSTQPIPWKLLDSKLALDAKPDFNAKIPHRVYTTSNLPPTSYPDQFRYWAQNDHTLSFRHLNNTVMDSYLDLMYPKGSPMVKVLESLPRRVLKADILRYTLLLHKGGIYSDTDTAAVKPFDRWGENPEDMTDFIVSLFPRMAQNKISASSLSDTATLQSLVRLPPPSLLIAIEMDGSDGKWREKSMARGLQFAQWTIAAQPGHPVFLDVLSRAVTKWESLIGEGKPLEDKDVLEWTGPGPWTDAVIRYILSRHGIHPSDYAQTDRPVRIGDVLILPVHAFQADASEGTQKDMFCVWHGFYGSWRSD